MSYPTLFIGLGGAGTKTVLYLKSRLQRLFSKEEMASSFRFLLMDTNRNEFDGLVKSFDSEITLDPDFLRLDDNYLLLGGFNPKTQHAYIERNQTSDQCKDIHEWLDPREAASFPNSAVSIGVGAQRQLGRFCFFHHWDEISNRLTAIFRDLNRAKSEEKIKGAIRTYVVTSCLGGTGSSSFFDLLYLLATDYQDLAHAEPDLRPVIFGPKFFLKQIGRETSSPKELGRYRANAIAFFTELEFAINAWRAGSKDHARLCARPVEMANRELATLSWCPYHAALVVDDQVEGGEKVFLTSLFQTTADLLAYRIAAGANDQIDDKLINFAAGAAKSGRSQGYPHYLALGFRALEHYGDVFRGYLTRRFLADAIQHHYIEGNLPTEKELRKQAIDIFDGSVAAPFRAAKPGSGVERFSEVCTRQLLSDHHRLRRARSIDRFLSPNPSKPDAEPDVDRTALTATNLEAVIDELQQERQKIRSEAISLFRSHYGDPWAREADSAYGAIWDALLAAMNGVIETRGIQAWCGDPAGSHNGLAQYLEEVALDRLAVARQELGTSNQRCAELLGDRKGIERLKSDILGEVEKLGGLFSRWSPTTALKQRLEQFAATRVQLLEETLRNRLVMLEIEVLSFVAGRGQIVDQQDYFSCQDTQRPSFLTSLIDQGRRISAWLVTSAHLAGAQAEEETKTLRRLKSADLIRFVPALDQIVDDRGTPGPRANEAIKHLANVMATKGSWVPEINASTGTFWPTVCRDAAGSASDAQAQERFLEAGRTWIARTISEQDAFKDLDQTLEAYVAGLPTSGSGGSEDLASILTETQVRVFADVNTAAGQEGQHFRAALTSSDGARGSLLDRLGYLRSEAAMAQSDPAFSKRLVVLKAYTSLYVQDHFDWWNHSFLQDYRATDWCEPHLHRNGRGFFQLSGSSPNRPARLFAAGMAWALIFRVWPNDDNLKKLFTTKLAFEKDFLGEAPVSIRQKEVFLLQTRLNDKMLLSDRRIEAPLPGGTGFMRVPGAGDYGAAFEQFLRLEVCQDNVEFFHGVAAGVDHVWSNDGSNDTLNLIQRERAEDFCVRADQVLQQQIKKKLQSLDEPGRHLTETDERTRRALGRIASELSAEIQEIRERLGSEVM